MTNTRETAEYAGPEGSIFLPKTERELRNHQLALLLGRGPGQGKTPEELWWNIERQKRRSLHSNKKLRQLWRR